MASRWWSDRPEVGLSAPQQAGADAEARAEAFLIEHGLAPIARNVRCRGGEVDLVMREGAHWVFVEVRARRSARFGGAAASVDARKQHRLQRAASHFLLRQFGQRPWPPCRFDVLAFEAGVPHWIRGAFEAG